MAQGQRDSKREAVWRSVLAKFQNSGLSIRAFCRQAKVTEASFYAWRRTIQRRDAEQARRPIARTGQTRPSLRPQPQPTFVPLVVRDGQARVAEAGITIELGRGSRVRVLHAPATIVADRLAELVRAIESVPVAPENQP